MDHYYWFALKSVPQVGNVTFLRLLAHFGSPERALKASLRALGSVKGVSAAAARAIVTKSFQEISAGSFLLPYQERKLTIPLKSADRDLLGYIVQTQTGNTALAVSDVVFLDLGRAQGAQPGNMLYIVRDVVPDQRYTQAKIEKLPVEVIGALVVVSTGMNSSTAVIVKSVDTVYRGDRVEMKKSR